MQVVRISLWSPDYDHTTIVVPQESVKDGNLEDFAREAAKMPTDFPFFTTHEVVDVESADLQEQTFDAMRAFQEKHNDERNMAIMYYWTGEKLRTVSHDGVCVQTIPSPLTIKQLTYVLKELVKHPYYFNQRLIAISEDGRLIEAQGNRIREIDAF